MTLAERSAAIAARLIIEKADMRIWRGWVVEQVTGDHRALKTDRVPATTEEVRLTNDREACTIPQSGE